MFGTGTRSSINTSDMWVTHRKRKRMKLRDPPSSVKTPKASEGMGRKPLGKPGRGRGLRGGVTGSGTSPGRGQLWRRLPVPLPSASGR